MHTRRNEWANVANDGLLGGSHIGQYRSWRQGRAYRLGQCGEGTNRGAQHDAIRALNRLRGVQFYTVGEA